MAADAPRPSGSDGPVLEVKGLSVHATVLREQVPLLSDVSLSLHKGKTLGLIGESGSGKTTLVRAVAGLLARNVHVTQGAISLDGQVICAPGFERYSHIRGSRVGMVFQGASSSLNPLIRVRRQLDEVLRVHRRELSRDQRTRAMTDALRSMRFENIDRVLRAFPFQLSGGMQQRIAIALAMLPRPDLLIADEATSALDVTTQAKVVELLGSVVDEGVGMVFVTHDLMLAKDICDDIIVLRHGQVVERGSTERVLKDPSADYTRQLLDATLDPWELQGARRPERLDVG